MHYGSPPSPRSRRGTRSGSDRAPRPTSKAPRRGEQSPPQAALCPLLPQPLPSRIPRPSCGRYIVPIPPSQRIRRDNEPPLPAQGLLALHPARRRLRDLETRATTETFFGAQYPIHWRTFLTISLLAMALAGGVPKRPYIPILTTVHMLLFWWGGRVDQSSQRQLSMSSCETLVTHPSKIREPPLKHNICCTP